MKKAIIFDTLNHTNSQANKNNPTNHPKIISTISSVLENDLDFVFYLCDKQPPLSILANPKVAYALTNSTQETLAILTSISRYYDILLVIHCDESAYKGRYAVSIAEVEELINSKRFWCLSKQNRCCELLMLG